MVLRRAPRVSAPRQTQREGVLIACLVQADGAAIMPASGDIQTDVDRLEVVVLYGLLDPHQNGGFENCAVEDGIHRSPACSGAVAPSVLCMAGGCLGGCVGGWMGIMLSRASWWMPLCGCNVYVHLEVYVYVFWRPDVPQILFFFKSG